MLKSLDHVVIGVRDLDAATGTYTRLLGRHPSWRGRHAEYGTVNTLYRLDNMYLELLAVCGEGALSALLGASLHRQGEGLFALAFATDDASQCAAWLRFRGLSASDPVEGGGRETTTAAERRWHNVFCPENETRGVRVFAIEHLSPAEALPRAVAVEAPEASVVGCDHVVISTDDPDASKALYGEKLGLRLALDRTFENWRVRLLFFRIAGITVELAGGLDADNDPTGTDTLWGLSYRVANVEAIRERLAGDGFEVSEVRKGRRPGTRVCTVRRETHGVATLLIGPDGST